MINTSSGAQPKYVIPESAAPASTSSADNANFKGHQLQATQSSRRVEAALQGKCALCLETFTNTEIKPLSLLPCFHVYHSECYAQALNQSCPDCRALASPSKIKIYQNSTLLRENLPLECTEDLCLVVGANASICSGTQALCPYPLATFPYQEAENFLENNHPQIIEWLLESFAQKHYTTANVRYYEKYCGTEFEHIHHKPAITLSVQHNPNEPMRGLYYSSADINKAKTAESAFTNLVEDIRTDLLILSLRNSHPAIFDSNTDLFIYRYDLWTYNAIFINGKNNSVPLRTIFNPSTKSFSWDRLKLELEKQGFEYKKLFETTPSERFFERNEFSRMRSFQSRGFDSVDGFHSNSLRGTGDAEFSSAGSQRPVSERALEIPSGYFDTNSFLF
ncbi:RING finger domain-containing protein [Endozoicomonas acroporae]|uniref:RING finger domain-containing protein n=1 Tax=Endozoicomonas acroporae TaxID=1701104 RepID=UPI0013CFABBA|nr:RING finger domain-containing protein [Endozoicomonas acroporae]